MISNYNNDPKYRHLTFDPKPKLQSKINEILSDEKTKQKLLTFTARAQRPRMTSKLHKSGCRIITNATKSPP